MSLDVTLNGERAAIPEGSSLADAVGRLTAAPSGVAAALNEAVVPRSDWDTTTLRPGDRVEVLTAVQGG